MKLCVLTMIGNGRRIDGTGDVGKSSYGFMDIDMLVSYIDRKKSAASSSTDLC